MIILLLVVLLYTIVVGRLQVQVVDEMRRAHVYVIQHGLELGSRESWTQFCPDGLPLFAPQVHQVVEQLVVLKRNIVLVPVDERPEVLYHSGVHQPRVSEHQQRCASLVHADIPLPVVPLVQRVDHVDERYVTHDHIDQATERRQRYVMRYAQPGPLAVVVRPVPVTHARDE